MLQNEVIVQPVLEDMLSKQERNFLMPIRFDCLVRAADCGSRKIRGGFLIPDRYAPPQWFRLEFYLSLDAVRNWNEYELGAYIKKAFAQLQDNIDKYEKGK